MNDHNLVGAQRDSLQDDRRLAPAEIDGRQIEIVMQSAAGGAKNIQDIYPLSPLQEGMLFHHLLNEHNDTYVLSTLFELASQAQIAHLVGALQKVIHRHDVLRTAILWERLINPLQVIQHEATLAVQEVMLENQPAAIEQFKERMKPGEQRLNLQEAPLMRLQVAADPHSSKWYALLQLHHVICDYRSWNLVTDEAMTILQGREHELPAPVPYRKQMAWMLARDDTHKAEEFFRRKLAAIPGPTVPFGVAELRGESGEHEEASQGLDPALAQRIRAHLRRHKTSAARLFHAAWAMVVAHTGNQDDVVFGTVLLTSQLRSARDERLLGLSVNTLPLRLRLHDVTAEALLLQTHEELVELVEHERTALALAQRCSGLDGAASLFTALLNYRRATPEAATPTGLGIRVVARGEAWTNYPLALTVDDLGDGFLLTAQTDLRIGARRVIDHLGKALDSLVDALEHSPHAPVLSLSVVPDGEWRQVVRSFNATVQSYSRETPIHRVFEEQVELTPTTVAAMHGNRSLTYEQLNAKANQLARHLRHRGVAPDQVVGIFVERGLEMVIGLLGILKAGAAYLPLDPSYPSERLQYMQEDAAPAFVLTQEKLQELLPMTRVESLGLEATLAALDDYSASNLLTTEVKLSTRSLVYVIYTSGSTGRPKGTEMPHSSMANLIEWHRQHLPLRVGERVLQFAALSFDVAFQEIFSTLCNGGTLVLLDEWMRTDARVLLDLLNGARIERLFVPPVMLQSLAEYSKMAGIGATSMRDVIVAGEQLRVSRQLVDFFKAQPACRLHNHYGPTETHVVTALTLDGNAEHWPTLPPIGRPITNVQIYVLDARRQPVSVGVVGEIYIAGANTARGYLSRPELTAERFVADPFHTHPPALMYKTGDLGRWRADGVIEYLGRNDDQVKIRGFRVELGEVEAQLARHSKVKEVAVVARGEFGGEKRLVAYITLRGDDGVSSEELSAYLKPLLPDHMIPSAFVVLDALPMTPSGKLNRLALPAPAAEAYAKRQYEPTQGQVESTLGAIWTDLLGVQPISRNDNFFKLGGNSISTLRLVVRVLEAFAVHLAAVSVFRYPLLQEMARTIEMSSRETTSHAGAVSVGPTVDEAPLTRQQLWLWQAAGGGASFHLMRFALRIRGSLNHEALRRACEALIRRHDSLRARIITIDGVPRQRFEKPGEFVLSVRDLSDAPGSAIDTLVTEAIHAMSPVDVNFNLEPLFQVRLLKLSEQEHVLIWFIDHIIVDMLAMYLLFEDLWRLYGKTAAGDYSVADIAAAQYADYSLWQQATLKHELKDNEAYWQSHLEGAAGIRWPWQTVAENENPLLASVSVSLGQMVSDGLRSLASHAGTTLGMAALAVYAVAISRLCKQRHFVVAITVSGRDRPGLDRLVGYCAYALYLRIQFAAKETFASLLSKVSQEFYQALSHGDFGAAVAQHPELHAHGLFQWASWPAEHPFDARPSQLGKLGLRAERFPAKLLVNSKQLFSQYHVMPILNDGADGISGMILCSTSAIPVMENFARDLCSTAEEMTQNPYTSIE